MNLPDSYTSVSQDYVDKIFDELDQKPKDRELLDAFAKSVGNEGRVCDLGCGPGQVAKYLHSRKLNVVGIDISPGMIEQAHRLNPQIEFQVADILSLPFPDKSLEGATAFYSLIHFSYETLPNAFKEINRVLRPSGTLLFSFHIGDETVHLDVWWEHKVNLDFHFFESEKIKSIISQSGFELMEVVERDPYSENIEHQSCRGYFSLKKLV